CECECVHVRVCVHQCVWVCERGCVLPLSSDRVEMPSKQQREMCECECVHVRVCVHQCVWVCERGCVLPLSSDRVEMPSKQQREMCVCVCVHTLNSRERCVCVHTLNSSREMCVCVCVCAHSKHFSLKVISYLRNSAAYFILWNPGPSRDVCVCVCERYSGALYTPNCVC